MVSFAGTNILLWLLFASLTASYSVPSCRYHPAILVFFYVFKHGQFSLHLGLDTRQSTQLNLAIFHPPDSTHLSDFQLQITSMGRHYLKGLSVSSAHYFMYVCVCLDTITAYLPHSSQFVGIYIKHNILCSLSTSEYFCSSLDCNLEVCTLISHLFS